MRELFKAYKQQIENTENVASIFNQSGMTNEYAILDYGFFPIGSGILSNNSEIEIAKINTCEIMVLGNDFGTIEYVDKKCPNKKEKESNPTIKNLLGLALNTETTFFTNLFLGLRNNGKNTDSKILTEDYKKFCFAFLATQIDILNPKIILCLGNEVLKSLNSYSSDFASISKKSISQLYANPSKNDFEINSGGRRFIIIPHPSYAHINWAKNNIKERIKEVIKGVYISQ